MNHSDILKEERIIKNGRETIKVWGKEKAIIFHEGMAGKIMDLKKGFGSSLHAHTKGKWECFYILSGRMLLNLLDTGTGKENWYICKPDDIIEINRGIPHQFIGIEDTRFVEFVVTSDKSTGETDNARYSVSRAYSDEEILGLMNIAEEKEV